MVNPKSSSSSSSGGGGTVSISHRPWTNSYPEEQLMHYPRLLQVVHYAEILEHYSQIVP